MRSSITLSVIHPPGPPEISGYASGDTVRMGDVMTLHCRSRGGNPLANLVWYRNNEQVDSSYTTVGGRESVNDYTFTVDASDNNAVYRCESSSPQTQPTPTVVSVKMTVLCESLTSDLILLLPAYVLDYILTTLLFLIFMPSWSKRSFSCIVSMAKSQCNLTWRPWDEAFPRVSCLFLTALVLTTVSSLAILLVFSRLTSFLFFIASHSTSHLFANRRREWVFFRCESN